MPFLYKKIAMNITQEKIDDLNAVIKIKLTPSDFKEKYEKKLKEYQRNANIPGFRPGKAPVGMIKKKYGQSILADELNNIINHNLQKHIVDNNVNVLGNPLPSEEFTKVETWDENSDFEFGYQIGLAPEFALDLSKKVNIPFYKIKVDEDTINKQIEDFTKRYGKMVPAETASEEDLVYGLFTELDENGNVKEGGITAKSTISIPFIEDSNTKKQLIGLKKDDVITVDPRKVSKGDSDMAAMLHIKKDEAPLVNSNFQFQAEEIKRMEKAAIDQELFDKVVGKDEVKDEKGFRAKIAEDMAKAFVNDSERLFEKSTSKVLLEKLNLSLPDEFLKKWIMEANERPITPDQLEKEYDAYANQLKWQLVENKVIKENEIKVELDEVREYTKGLLINQYAQYGLPAPDDKQLEDNVQNVLKNQEELKNIFDYLYKRKVFDLIKEQVKLDEQEVTQEEFIKLFYEN